MALKDRTDMLNYARMLTEHRLVAGTWGNISIRSTEGILITPSGIGYNGMTQNDLVYVDLDGNIVNGIRKPSSEMLCHLSIYKKFPQVGAIVHTHSTYACACAAVHQPIPAMLEDQAQIIGGTVNVAEYALPGTQALADNLLVALQNKSAVLLANHGVIACGQDINEAFTVAEIVEKSAKIYIMAQQLGGGMELDPEDIKQMRDNYLNNYRKLQKRI